MLPTLHLFLTTHRIIPSSSSRDKETEFSSPPEFSGWPEPLRTLRIYLYSVKLPCGLPLTYSCHTVCSFITLAWSGTNMKLTHCSLGLCTDPIHCQCTQQVWPFLDMLNEPQKMQTWMALVSGQATFFIMAMCMSTCSHNESANHLPHYSPSILSYEKLQSKDQLNKYSI